MDFTTADGDSSTAVATASSSTPSVSQTTNPIDSIAAAVPPPTTVPKSTTTKPKPKKKDSPGIKHKSSTSTKKGQSKSGGTASSSIRSYGSISASTLTKKAKSLLEKLQFEKDATFHDSAWLSSSTRIPTSSSSNAAVSLVNNTMSPSFLEHDIEIVEKALKQNGLLPSDISAEAFGCLLESARKYALTLIDDAVDYAMLSSKDEVTSDDLQLAHDMQQEDNYNSNYHLHHPEYLDLVTQIADETNRIILPPIPDECYNGIVLPPPEYNLLGRTFDIVNPSIVNTSKPINTASTVVSTEDMSGSNKGDQDKDTTTAMEVDNETTINADNTDNTHEKESSHSMEQKQEEHHEEVINPNPSYGASRGPQIEIKLHTNKSL